MKKKNEGKKIDEKMYKALFRKLSKIATAVAKKPIKVIAIPETEDAIGYTSADRVVHLNPNHKLIDDLDVPQKIKFVKGVWTHEMMHQLITNFSAATILRKENKYEDYIYHEVFNIVEDARIENLAPNFIGGIYTEDVFGKNGRLKQMSDLTFSKRVIYKKTPPIDAPDPAGNPPYPLAQVINAMIQYGDSGVIKGEFLDEQAKEIFAKLLPIYDEITEEYNFQRVLQKSIKITEIMRPLWEDNAKALDQLKNMMEQAARDNHANNKNRSLDRSGSGNSSSGSKSESLASKARKATRKKISAEEASKMLENGEAEAGSGSGNGGEEYEVEDPENLSEEAKEKLKKVSKGSGKGKSDEEGEESEEGSGGSEEGNSDGEEGDKSSSTGKSGKEKGTAEGEQDGEGEGKDSSGKCKSEGEDSENEKSSAGADKDGDSGEGSEDGSSSSEGGSSNDASGKGSGKPSSDDSAEEDNSIETYSKNSKGNYSELGNKAKKGGIPDAEYYKNEDTSEPENNDFLDDVDDYEIPESEISSMINELEGIIKSEAAEEKRLEDDFVPVDINITSKYFSSASVINRNVKVVSANSDSVNTKSSGSDILVSSSYDVYEHAVKALRPSIKGITRQFERLFKNKSDEKYHKTSGKVNIPRMNSGRITSRIFDRTVSGRKATDIAMYLCIDESGSMCHNRRYEYAKLTAIGLAEMCESLKIPLYVMGFTADEGSGSRRYDAVHMHYIKWKNNKRTRLNLLTISARSNNFDGYSIRYATKMLSKRPENTKILIVISDGAPACYRYDGADGIEDTKLAIKEANRHCTALGVAIGGGLDNARLKEIYGTNFLDVPDVSTLFQQLATKLRKMIKEEI